MNRLYLFRQAGPHRHGLTKGDLLDWISQPNWQSSFRIFQDTVTEALVRHTKMSQDAACELLRASFSDYLATAIGYRPHPTALGKKINALRRTLEQSPTARSVYDQIRRIKPGSRSDLRLERLLSPASPYHDDFMPVYRAITSDGIP